MTKVLAFTASAHRPLMLRHCIYQMQQQSIGLSHGIFLNSDSFHSADDQTNYAPLISDLIVGKAHPLRLAYGKQGHQHFNHVTAIQQFDINDFDLFIKIDDDDIYLKDYVEKLVSDFEERQWDFSGSASAGIINGANYEPNQHSYLNKVELESRCMHFMPGTYAFSRKAINFIIETGNNWQWNNKYEDKLWLDWLLEHPELTVNDRKPYGYIYNIHGSNFSTHHLLDT